jgi:hypothetical protein
MVSERTAGDRQERPQLCSRSAACRKQFRGKVYPCTAQPIVGITLKSAVGEGRFRTRTTRGRLKTKMPTFAVVGNRASIRFFLFRTSTTSLATRSVPSLSIGSTNRICCIADAVTDDSALLATEEGRQPFFSAFLAGSDRATLTHAIPRVDLFRSRAAIPVPGRAAYDRHAPNAAAFRG